MKTLNYYKFRLRAFILNLKRKVYFSLRKNWNKLTKKSKLGLPFPKEVNIGARMFNIQEHEGIITFSAQNQYCFYGMHERISFHRPKYAQWYMEYSTTFKDIRPSFVLDCYKIVCDYRGDDFNRDMAIDGSL